MWQRPTKVGGEDAVGTVRHAGRFGGHLAVGKHQQGALGLLKNFTGEGEELATNKVIEYAGGDSYEGQVLRGLKHGQGTYTWANGASYTGEWANNVPCGDGSYSWLDGESYKGAFKFGRRHGSGAYTWTSGASFVGVFRDDVPVGKGICTLPGGRCFHGEYALFAAYLRASEMQRGRKQADVWVAAKWAQSSDLLRNPPWLGFTAVRPGRRHYDKAVSGSGAQALAAAPVVTPKVLSIGWPKAPFEQTEGLDLAHGPSMHMAPRQVGFEWPRVGPPPSRKVEDDVEEEARDDYHIWHVGDVCECLDMVGAPLRSIGMAELPGRLTPQQPHGLYFKVRLEAVEFVWPGFTETTFPLVICKVVYVGIDPSVKPSEWVPASRLRTAMAAPNFGNPLWKGWQVSNSACGEYVKDAFVTTEVVEVNETVECLLPFSGQDRQGDQAALPALPPPPRLLEVASAQMAHEMLLVADPDADGMWVLATPAMLVTLPQLLVKLGLWDLLFKRVWGSLPFMALMVLEHGPDLLCSHMDMTRAALAAEEAEEDLLQDHPDYVASANSWAWVGTKVDGDKVMAQMLAAQDDADNAHDAQLSTRLTPKQVFSLHHEFAHMHKEALRRRALIEVATEANLPAVDALNHLVSGEAGLVAKMSYAMEKATSLDEPSPAIRSLLLMTLRKLRHLKLLGLVPTLTEYIERQENKVSAFLADQAMQSGSRSSVFDDLLQVVSSPGGKRTRKALEAIDAYALEFQANAPHQEEQAVLRLELDATFSCEHSGQVVSRVLLFLKEFPAMRGATLSILRVEAGSTPETNRDMSRTVLHVAVSALPQLRVACAEVVEAFYNEADAEAFGSIWSFASIARERYRLVRVDLLNPSVFLSLTFLRSSSPLQGIKSSEASLLQRALLWRSLLLRILPHLNDQEIAEEVQQLWFAQRLREDLGEATELSRRHIHVVSVGACRTRAVVELVSEDKGVAHATLLAAALKLQALVEQEESQFVGGVPVALFEYVQAVDVSSGYMPPAAAGEWPSVGVFCGSSGADTMPERAVLSSLVIPALQRVLHQHGIYLRCLDLSLHGPRQGSRAHTRLDTRLRAMDALGMQATGSRITIPMFLGILAGEGPCAQQQQQQQGRYVLGREVSPGEIVAGQGNEGPGNCFSIRAWAGDTAETSGLVRPAGRDRLSMQASVVLMPGEYTGAELMQHLALLSQKPSI